MSVLCNHYIAALTITALTFVFLFLLLQIEIALTHLKRLLLYSENSKSLGTVVDSTDIVNVASVTRLINILSKCHVRHALHVRAQSHIGYFFIYLFIYS